MEQWIMDVMNDYGYLGVFLLIAFENLFPPIPSEVILTFGGFMTAHTDMTVTGVVVASTLGSVAGAVVLYVIGRCLSAERVERIVDKWGYILRLKREDVHKAQSWFDKYGAYTVFFCRFVPLIRSLISIPAGMAKMRFPFFLLLTTIGTSIWNVVLVSLGAKVGDSWEVIVSFMDTYSTIAYLVLGLLGVACVVWYVRSRKPKTHKAD